MNDPADPRVLLARIQETLREVYRAGEVEADGCRLKIAPTGMRHDQGEAIAAVLRALGARRTLETGFAFGLSGLFMLHASLENGADPLSVQALHTALDPFQSERWKRAGLRLFARTGVAHLLRFVPDRSELHLPLLVQANERFDAVLVDGDHRFEGAFADVLFATKLVVPGGAVLVDDLWMPSVRAVVEYFTTNVGLRRDDAVRGPASPAFAVLRMPERLPEREWDHYVPFDAGLGTPAFA